MRRGEILGLRWQDVGLERAQLSVRQALVSVAYTVTVSSPKTPRSRRSLALDPATVAALTAHRQRRSPCRGEPGGHSADLVFTRADGRWVHPDRFTQMFDKHVRGASLKRIR